MSESSFGKKLYQSVRSSEQLSLILALLILSVVITILSPVFLTVFNLTNVLRQSSLVAITGIGMVLVILTGEIDLSVGSSVAVVGVAAVWILNLTGSIFLAITAGILLGGVFGLINGLLVTKGQIASLIATLGMLSILRGVAFISTKAVSIQVEVPSFGALGSGSIGPFPVPVIIMAVLLVLFYYILNHTMYGRYIYAIGGNSSAAHLSGIPVVKLKIQTFIVSGLLTGLTGCILASRMYSGQPNAGSGFELEVVSAVILGGLSLNGGVGTLVGAFVGVLILGVLQNGLTLMNVSSFYQEVARGLVLILAVYLDGYRKRKMEKSLLKESEPAGACDE